MIFIKPIIAQCPVCVVTVGGGILLAKKFGVDDLLMSLWIAGLNAAISIWLAPKFKNILLKNSYFLAFVLLATTLIYFQTSNQMGSSTNTVLGINKVVFGQIIGTLLIFLGSFVDKYSRKLNNGKILFYYQKVIFPVGFLILFSIIFKLSFNL